MDYEPGGNTTEGDSLDNRERSQENLLRLLGDMTEILRQSGVQFRKGDLSAALQRTNIATMREFDALLLLLLEKGEIELTRNLFSISS